MRVLEFSKLALLAGVLVGATLTFSMVPAMAKIRIIHSSHHRGSSQDIYSDNRAKFLPSYRLHRGDASSSGRRLEANGRKNRFGSHGLVRLAAFSFHGNWHHGLGKNSKASYGYGGLQCVPFARAASGIELKGNAANWWDAAEGVYERGARPEAGSVLNFRANGHMHLGHVAVVTAVVDSRQIEIEHANWAGPGAGKGGVSRNIPVVDVSPENDWTQVRVGLGHSGDYGSMYPTYGFIYDRPDRGTMEANGSSGYHRVAHGTATMATFDEVAQAPAVRFRSIKVIEDLNSAADAPSRDIR